MLVAINTATPTSTYLTLPAFIMKPPSVSEFAAAAISARWCQQKICLTAVEGGAGGGSCWHIFVRGIGGRGGDDQRLPGACSVIQRADPCRIVRNPPRAAETSGQAPRVY